MINRSIKKRFTWPIGAAGIMLLVGVLLSNAVQSQQVLQPGEFKDDFDLKAARINQHLIRFVKCPGFNLDFSCTERLEPPGDGEVRLSFEANKILLKAEVKNNLGLRSRKEAFSRGKFFTDFCIAFCGEGGNQETVTATVTYRLEWAGRVTTFNAGTKADVGISVFIRDLTANRTIHAEPIYDESFGNLFGRFVTIAGLPVPIPEIDDPKISETRVFVAQFTPGHTYRFELFAAARATLPLGGGVTRANANFFENIQILDTDQSGVKLATFTLDVGLDSAAQTEELKLQIASLQKAVGDLADQIVSSEEDFSVQISNAALEIDALNAIIESLEEQLASLQDGLATVQDDLSTPYGLRKKPK